jgi:diacylglycerol kinase family enzyme
VKQLGTFNFFARGLGLPEDPEGAAQAILTGQVRRISVGTVNGQLFLNNASLGIYPRILQAREASYARWGRSRLLAYWTVLLTLLRYQAARRVIVTVEGQTRNLRSPLIFVARSAYQLQRFGLTGAQAISDDRFAVFIALGGSRWHLLKLALHLALGRVIPGEDVEVLYTRQMQVRTTKRRPNVAFDGEKRRMLAPLSFEIQPDALSIILPAEKVAP